MNRKRILLFILIGVLWICFAFPVAAQAAEEAGEYSGGTDETESLPPEYYELEQTLPEEMRERLPDGLFSDKPEEVANAAERLTDPSYLYETLSALTGVSLRGAVSLLLTLCGILVLSAVIRRIQADFGGQSGEVFGFCSKIAIFSAITSTVIGTVETVQTYFSNLSGFCTALIPVTGTLYAIGGNVRTAVASSAVLELYLSVVGGLAGSTVVPLFCACTVLLLIGVFGSPDVSGLSAFLRKTYLTVLSFLMLLLSVLLGARSVLASRADSVGMRGVRFAVGNLIPVVGGSVADMSQVVAAGVSYLRGTVGIILILLLGFLLVPTVIRLFLTRAVFSLSSAVAELMNCGAEGQLLRGIAELYGYLIGVASLCVSVAVVALAVLVTCGSALGS